MHAGYERLGHFYLGKHVDSATGELRDDLLLYKSKDLTTHGVIVGMTGSGKTGLGVSIIEEAVMDAIPVIAIDPKGDLGNLLLTFPSFDPADFRPWINESDAATKGLTADEYAAEQAALWQEGLANWGQDSQRITAFERAAERCIYTPGSTAGRPLSMLASFKAPTTSVAEDSELLGERIDATVSGLLSLLKIDADPVASREYVLLANILAHSWREGRDLDLASLIAAVQAPPFQRVGMMGVETFFRQQERFDFTLRMNHLLAAPGFQTWLQGDPLDAGRLFYTVDGRPRLSIASIAHLSDTERMFALTSLLNEIVSWMRGQPGTSSLRALVYVDEVFGFLPPVSNPPSKKLFLTLLKQARAFGLGTVLSTQNPVDLDYKALSNAGTWFIGRLQTERDKARLLDGLTSAADSEPTDIGDLSSKISGLQKRQFVLHNVHASEPAVFGTRWVMSYLAGPMTREQIRALNDAASTPGAGAEPPPQTSAGASAPTGAMPPPQTGAAPSPQTAAAPPARVGAEASERKPIRDESTPQGSGVGGREEGDPASRSALSETKPILPSDVAEFYVADSGRDDRHVHYRPLLFCRARVAYSEARLNVREESDWIVYIDAPDHGLEPEWDMAAFTVAGEIELSTKPAASGTFDVPPSSLQDPSNFKKWSRSLETWIERNHALELFKSPLLDLIAESGETEADFRLRVNLRAREERDRETEAIQKKLEARLRKVEDRLQRAEHAVARESQQADQARVSSTIAVGQTILGALLGRKFMSRGTVSRAGTAVRSASRISKEAADVERAREKVDRIEDEITDLTVELEAALDDVRTRYEAEAAFETVKIRPKTSETAVLQAGVLWQPV